MSARVWAVVAAVALVLAAGCSGELGRIGDAAAPARVEWQPVECMPRAEVEAALGEPVGPEEAYDVALENPCGAQSAQTVTVVYGWGTVDYVNGVAVGWVEGAT